MNDQGNSVRRTAVYIDGYNLYYGRLRGTSFKWLDLVKLFDVLLAKRDQNEQLVCVNLFTAPALARFATHGKQSVEAQQSYLRALEVLHGERVKIVYGNHSIDSSGTLLPSFIKGFPYDRNVKTAVWKIEEKKTDVNLALGMYRDACKGLYDRMILVSNDSDAEPALMALKEDFPEIMRGLVIPIPPPIKGVEQHRRVSGSLRDLADWTITSIPDALLEDAQLKGHVPTAKKPIKKPLHW